MGVLPIWKRLDWIWILHKIFHFFILFSKLLLLFPSLSAAIVIKAIVISCLGYCHGSSLFLPSYTAQRVNVINNKSLLIRYFFLNTIWCFLIAQCKTNTLRIVYKANHDFVISLPLYTYTFPHFSFLLCLQTERHFFFFSDVLLFHSKTFSNFTFFCSHWHNKCWPIFENPLKQGSQLCLTTDNILSTARPSVKCWTLQD